MPDHAAARHRLIDAVLSPVAGGDSRAVGVAIRAALASFSTELAELIGQRGVRSLYDRSLHLARARYAWLEPIAGAPSDEPFADVQGRLTERSVDEALEAGAALLVEFTSLLAVLIGEALTERLMRKAWDQDAQAYPSSENRK
jgi:uncharacterized damage-inducible protein DinB